MGNYYSPEIECAGRDALMRIQLERLKALAAHAYKNVPLYKKKFDEIGILPEDVKSLADIGRLPFTTKTDIRDCYPYKMLAVPDEQIARIHASSGTTGKPTVVGYTRGDLELWAECCARAIAAAGGQRGDHLHVAYGYGLFTGGLGLHAGGEKLGLAVIPVSSGNTKRQIQILTDFHSDILCCTPSYALYIGETLAEMGYGPDDIPLRAGIMGAEPWTDRMRLQIEKLLGIKAYDIFGMSELCGPGVSFECEAQEGMHINEDYFYPEIIDPETGEAVAEGESGELVITCLNKEAMPLIRYRTRDITSFIPGKCSCGRSLARVRRLTGRTDDMLIIRGINVFPSQVESVLLEMNMVTPNYLLIVDRENNLDTLEVQVEITEAFFSDSVRDIEHVERKIAHALRDTLNISAKVRLVDPRTIARSQGKAKRVVDKRVY